MNRLKNIFTPKRVAIFFLSIFLILFFAGGCSFKYMDWQYYKFKILCENVHNEKVIYDDDYWEMLQKYRQAMRDNYTKYYYYEKLDKNLSFQNWEEVLLKSEIGFGIGKLIKENFDQHYLDEEHNVKIINYNRYIYINKGLWIGGDEGGGFYLITNDKLDCLDINGDRG